MRCRRCARSSVPSDPTKRQFVASRFGRARRFDAGQVASIRRPDRVRNRTRLTHVFRPIFPSRCRPADFRDRDIVGVCPVRAAHRQGGGSAALHVSHRRQARRRRAVSRGFRAVRRGRSARHRIGARRLRHSRPVDAPQSAERARASGLSRRRLRRDIDAHRSDQGAAGQARRQAALGRAPEGAGAGCEGTRAVGRCVSTCRVGVDPEPAGAAAVRGHRERHQGREGECGVDRRGPDPRRRARGEASSVRNSRRVSSARATGSSRCCR